MELDTRLLRGFINKIYVEYGFSKNYMASILKVVKGSLKYACCTLNYINTNPAEHVHAPGIDKIGKDHAHIFTKEEIERILDRFKGTHSIYYAFFTAYYIEMRTGEVFALTWDDINLENRTIKINKTVYVKDKEKNGRWYLGTVKTICSHRGVYICDTLYSFLFKYKELQNNYKKPCFYFVQEMGFISKL